MANALGHGEDVSVRPSRHGQGPDCYYSSPHPLNFDVAKSVRRVHCWRCAAVDVQSATEIAAYSTRRSSPRVGPVGWQYHRAAAEIGIGCRVNVYVTTSGFPGQCHGTETTVGDQGIARSDRGRAVRADKGRGVGSPRNVNGFGEVDAVAVAKRRWIPENVDRIASRRWQLDWQGAKLRCRVQRTRACPDSVRSVRSGKAAGLGPPR